MAEESGTSTTPDPGDRRDPQGGRTGDRRRGGWREFRRAYPGFVFTLFVGLIAMLAIDGLLIMKRRAYANEVTRLQANMTDQERSRTDAIVEAENNKTRIALELARRQAQIEKTLHISIAVDSGKMYLEREGVVLREMAAAFGPEGKVGPDSIPVVIPRGEMSVATIGTDRFTLDGGTVISASSAPQPAQDPDPIPPGSVRVPLADMKAILPNLKVGMPVYFY